MFGVEFIMNRIECILLTTNKSAFIPHKSDFS